MLFSVAIYIPRYNLTAFITIRDSSKLGVISAIYVPWCQEWREIQLQVEEAQEEYATEHVNKLQILLSWQQNEYKLFCLSSQISF